MINNSLQSLKEVATDLAALITSGSPDTAETEALLRQLGYNPVLPTLPACQPEPIQPGVEERIGIWKKVHLNGSVYYEREGNKQADWHFWANVHRLYPKGNRKRVVLLGESVARGYFYHPYYTVAAELQAVLHTSGGLPDCEVIDLARTSIGMAELLEVAKSCLALEPDAVVIFAGNNWHGESDGSLRPEDYKEMYEIYVQQSFPGIKKFIEKKYQRIVTRFLAALQATVASSGIPVTFIIPGFNLGDWKSDEIEKIIPWLPQNRISEWLEAKTSAEQALSSGDNDCLARAAGLMAALDPSNPLGHELLAQSYQASGKHEEALECLEEASETVIVGRGNKSKPRCFRVIRNTLLAEAGKYGVRALDLDQILKKASSGKVPGRDLYLDYCHLTAKGIKIAARHAAQALIEQIAGKRICLEELQDLGLQPAASVQASAHFCAAVHNAHWGQTSDVLNYHCSKAVLLSPGITDTMLQFADCASRRASTVLCKSFEETIQEGNMSQYEGGRGLTHPRGRKLLDIELVDAIVGALQSTGVDVECQVRELRKKEHGVDTRPVDLLSSFYHLSGYNEFAAQPHPCFMQSRTTKVCFTFIASANKPLLLDLEYRTPAESYPDKCVKITVNNAHNLVAELPMRKKWSTHSCIISEELLKDGVNKLFVEWPYTFEPLACKYPIGTRDAIGLALFPVLGEIYTMKLSVPSEAALVEQCAFTSAVPQQAALLNEAARIRE